MSINKAVGQYRSSLVCSTAFSFLFMMQIQVDTIAMIHASIQTSILSIFDLN